MERQWWVVWCSGSWAYSLSLSPHRLIDGLPKSQQKYIGGTSLVIDWPTDSGNSQGRWRKKQEWPIYQIG
jgi:hypothetical protein